MEYSKNDFDLLEYEIFMFREVFNQRKILKEKSRFENNYLIELLVLHTRVLVEFFYYDEFNKKRRYKDDILAQDLLKEVSWDKERPPITDVLRKAKYKADKQLAHLSRVRSQLQKNGEGGWSFSKIERDLGVVTDKFLKFYKQENF